MKAKVLFALSILAGLAAMFFVQVHIKGQKGNPVVVFRTTGPVKSGEAIGNRFEAVTLPGDRLFPNILKEAPTGEMEEFVSNTPVVEALEVGQLILYRHMENTIDPGLRVQIPVGKKAISIPVSEASSVSFMVQPGDLVDVLATIPVLDNTLGRETLGERIGDDITGVATKPLLQAVKVMAVGGEYRRAEVGRRQPYGSVTLLVNLEEAQKLAFARDVLNSNMTLLLRSEEDAERESDIEPLYLGAPAFDQIGNR